MKILIIVSLQNNIQIIDITGATIALLSFDVVCVGSSVIIFWKSLQASANKKIRVGTIVDQKKVLK